MHLSKQLSSMARAWPALREEESERLASFLESLATQCARGAQEEGPHNAAAARAQAPTGAAGRVAGGRRPRFPPLGLGAYPGRWTPPASGPQVCGRRLLAAAQRRRQGVDRRPADAQPALLPAVHGQHVRQARGTRRLLSRAAAFPGPREPTARPHQKRRRRQALRFAPPGTPSSARRTTSRTTRATSSASSLRASGSLTRSRTPTGAPSSART